MLKIKENPKQKPMIKSKEALPVATNGKKVVFSFFAGAGFLDLGFEASGFEVAFTNELNESFLNAYKFARTKMKIPEPEYGYHQGDMADLIKGAGRKKLTSLVRAAKRQGAVVGFIGGPPCPDFSVAGKNLGRDGLQGKLSATYTTLISQQKPDFFLFENVKGLWRTRSHRQYYEELKLKLQKNGYVLTERLINSLEYGVPQDRDRIILVGFRKKIIPSNLIDSRNKHMLASDVFPWTQFIKYPRDKIFAKYKQAEATYKSLLPRKPRGVPEDTMVAYWFTKNSVAKHPNAKHYFNPQALSRFRNTKEGDVSGRSFKRLHRWRYSPTVAYGNNEVHLHPYKPRRISAAEALSLQSLPKKFVLPDTMTLSEMFKAIGNGVPYVAARAVARTVNTFLNSL